ncbi:MAG: 4Fe-4S dicluster domain-containing protein [Cyanobacteria bacterium REEB67]|nr:4Fe-4S dicluster domain-containing protein [Cyanobacteria bacterium REEB67]
MAADTTDQNRVIDLSSGAPRIAKDLLESCIHCGLCLPACPTYLATGREMESPRGRIFLINQWQESLVENPGAMMNERASQHIDSCLGCLGCQTACPSGVQYEELLNSTRALNTARQSVGARAFMRFAFSELLPHYGRLLFLGSLLRLVQMIGLDSFFVKSMKSLSMPRLKLLNRLASWQMFVPRVPPHVTLPQKTWRSGAKKGNVQLFAGCVMDVFYNHVNHAAIRLLKKRQLVVSVPPQTCCGALAFHAGFVDIASQLARQNIDLFLPASALAEAAEGRVEQSAVSTKDFLTEPIAVTSAGCGAMLKHYGHLLEADSEYAERARLFSERVKDLSEVLYQYQSAEGAPPCKASGPAEKIVYHAACHLAHAQGVRIEPASLLSEEAALTGAHLYDLPEAEHCCGSAGIYNLINTEMSLAVLDRKMKFIEESGADVVVTSNPGCMLQLEAGIKARGLNVKVKHLAEALDANDPASGD